jgi:phosphomannomutase/phosphoglucomutase
MIFRAYDIRGTVGEDLTTDIAEKIGRAFGSEMGGAPFVLVGRDNRLSSAALAEALMSGIRDSGLHTIEIGEVATPILYHASVTNGSCPAVMVTGSHLPPDQNGFKITLGLDPFFGDDLQRLRGRIERDDYASGKGEHRLDEHAASRYLGDLAGRFTNAQKPLTILIDAGNGMAGLFAPTLIHYMGHDIIELYCESDGTYPHHLADPFEEENLLDAKAMLLMKNADLALVFDGDADRLGMIDGLGYSHATDRLLIPLVWDILRRNPGATIVTDSLVSSVLIETIKAAGGIPLMWKSGHSNIKNKMKEVRAPIALETSGHVFIADDYYGYDDGMYTGMRMVELLSRQHTAPLAEIMAAIPRLHTTPQFRPKCPEDKKQAVIQAIAEHFKDYDLNLVDGVRVTKPEGWFIVRASNTEAKLSLRFEGQDEDALQGMVGEVRQILEKQAIVLM